MLDKALVNLVFLVNFSLFGNINTSIISYTKLLIDTLLNISILPLRNRVVKSILVLFWIESGLMLAEYCSSKSIRLFD